MVKTLENASMEQEMITRTPSELTSQDASSVYVLKEGTILVTQLQKICIHNSPSCSVHRMFVSLSAMDLYETGDVELSFDKNFTAVVSSIAADSGSYFKRKSGHSSEQTCLKNSHCWLSATSTFEQPLFDTIYGVELARQIVQHRSKAYV